MLHSLFSSPASCPPPISLHPDQLIDTCTAWHWEPAHSLIHGLQPSLKSLSAINTHTRRRTGWRKTPNTQQRRSVGEPAEQKQEQHHRSSSLLDSALTHAELWAELRRHLAHSSDDDKSQTETDRRRKEEKEMGVKRNIQGSKLWRCVTIE